MNLFHRIRERFFSGRFILARRSGRAERGKYGEKLAADYCKRDLGYQLIARNWRNKRDEIDLVCRDGEVLVFVEVRARAKEALVSGYHSVDAKKKKALRRACKAYLKLLHIPPKHFRFDVIEIVLIEGECGEVRHYANIPLFSKYYTPGI